MDIRDFEDRHEGESAVIVGNGPSLQHTPLGELNNYTTFAMNRINKIFEDTSWRPDYYLFQGNKKHERYRDDAIDVIDRGITTFIQENKRHLYPNYENVLFFSRIMYSTEELLDEVGASSLQSISDEQIIEMVNKCWSTDINEFVYAYENSMIPLTQIVSYMGFKKMYFVGCDGYAKQKPYMLFDSGSDPCGYSNEFDTQAKMYIDFLLSERKPLRSFVNGLAYTILTSKQAPYWLKSAFSEDNYFKQGYHNDIERFWRHEKRNRRLRLAHEVIEEAGKSYDFQTYNATVDGNIDIHTPISLDQVINDNRN